MPCRTYASGADTAFGRLESAADISRNTGLPMLRPSQVGTVFDTAMRQDKDGAVYCIHPGGLPAIEIPYTEFDVLTVSVMVATVLTKLGLSGEGRVVTPLQIGVLLGASAMVAFCLIQAILCWILF